MARVTKGKNSKHWIACFTSRDGRQLKRSTKTTNKQAALQIAQELEDVERKSLTAELTTAQDGKLGTGGLRTCGD